MNQEILVGSRKNILSNSWLSLMQILVGSAFLGLMAQAAIPLPFTPVPVSLQTLAVFLLAIALGSFKAPLAVIVYLFQATIGLPVLAGGVSNPFWLFGPKAGYLIGFVLASYSVAWSLEQQKKPTFFKTCLILSLNEYFILLVGSLWLAQFVGWKNALLMGAYPFLPGSLVKITIAACTSKPIEWLKCVCK